VLACVCVYVCIHVHISMYRLCGRIDSWVEVRVRICFTCVFHRVCVYVCLHVHISMYHLCGGIDSWMEVRVCICFTCVFHRCVCMCVYKYTSICIACVVE
jgi:hypothetical protein